MKKKDLKSFIKEVLSEELNPQDTITMDVPLFIRALEYAKEDAKTDMDLHNATEKALSVSEGGKTLTMADYNSIFSNTESINEDDYMQSDDESDMAHSQLLSIKSNTDELMNMIDKDEQLDAWVQAKLTKAQDYLEAVSNYLKGEETNQSTLNEAGSANARGVAIAFKKDILDSMEFGTGAEERFPLILKYIEDNEIKGIDPEEVVVELNDLMRDVNEKKLTTAEKNKKEEIVKSMKKDFKGPKAAMYAIATDKAKKIAETIAKKIKEGNLGHNEISSIHQEGNSWIVTYKNMNGTQEKVFKTEKEAREFQDDLDDLDGLYNTRLGQTQTKSLRRESIFNKTK